MDGRIGGKFIIKQGGITQGIASELGLTRAECKQISGSIWTQVINEFNNEQSMNVQNNRGATPNADNNYTVHENAVITFSKECWGRIVALINNALGKNIQVEDTEIATGTVSAQATQSTQTMIATQDAKPLTAQQIQRKEAHEQVVRQAVAILKQNWQLSGLGEHFTDEADRNLYLQCLDEIVYDADKTGAGHAEAGIIHIETDNEQVNTTTEMLKLLIHEANHAFLESKATQNNTLNYPTKAEETECETLALTATARLVNASQQGQLKGVDNQGKPTNATLESYDIYDHPITYYTDSNKVSATPGFQNWLQGYNKLADNLNGDITIQHAPSASITVPEGTEELADNDCIVINGQSYKVSDGGQLIQSTDTGRKLTITHDTAIKVHGKLYNISVQDKSVNELRNSSQLSISGGDVLTIQGFPPINIGQNAMLEGIDNTSITQLIVHHKNFETPTILGTIIFDEMKPTQEELNMVNPNLDPHNAVPFVIKKADGTEIKGTCYPNREQLTNLQ